MPINAASYPSTVAQIQASCEKRGVPQILDNDQWCEIVDSAIREFDDLAPLKKYVKFLTVMDQQDYYIFDPSDVNTHISLGDNNFQALIPDALEITDVFWNPGGDWSSLNIFSPGWQLLGQMIIFQGSYFHQPALMEGLRFKLDAWKRQFGDQGFEVWGDLGDPKAFLRLYPVPREQGDTVVVEYTTGHTLDILYPNHKRAFMYAVEHYAYETIANTYAQTAGASVLGFKDPETATAYFSKKADSKKAYFDRLVAGIGGNATRG
jgi:hypothetical protein